MSHNPNNFILTSIVSTLNLRINALSLPSDINVIDPPPPSFPTNNCTGTTDHVQVPYRLRTDHVQITYMLRTDHVQAFVTPWRPELKKTGV